MDSKGFLLRRSVFTQKGTLGDILYLTIFYANNDVRNGVYKWTEREGLVLLGNPFGNSWSTAKIVGSHDGKIVHIGDSSGNGRLFTSVDGTTFTQRNISPLIIPLSMACSGDGSILYISRGQICKINGLNATNSTSIFTGNSKSMLSNTEGALLYSYGYLGDEECFSTFISNGLSPAINRYIYDVETNGHRVKLAAASGDFNKIYLLLDYFDDSGLPTTFLYSNDRLTSRSTLVSNQQIYSAVCSKDGSKAFLHSGYYQSSYLRAYLNGAMINEMTITGVARTYKDMVYSGNDVLYLSHNDNRRVFKSDNGTSTPQEIVNIGSSGTITGLFTNIDKR